MDSLSPSLAFLAGNLAVVNPRGCATFPAFLSFYVGAETTYVGAETTLPSMRGRMAQGLVVGLTVTAAIIVGAALAVLGARSFSPSSTSMQRLSRTGAMVTVRRTSVGAKCKHRTSSPSSPVREAATRPAGAD